MNFEDWEAVYSAQDVDDKVSAFNYIVIRTLDETCPLKIVRIRSTDKPWMTPSIKNEIKARQFKERSPKVTWQNIRAYARRSPC